MDKNRIYPLFGLQSTLDSLGTEEKKDALDRHLAHYASLVKSEAEARTVAELAMIKKGEADALYVLLYIGEELGMAQSAVLDLVRKGQT